MLAEEWGCIHKRVCVCVCVCVCVHTCIVHTCELQTVCLLHWVHMCMLEVHVYPDSHPNSLVQAFSYFNQSVVTITM